MYQAQVRAAGPAGRDLAAQQVVAELEAALNARNETRVAALFSETASWTRTDGTRIEGRAAIGTLARHTLSALGVLDVRLKITAMTHLRPDVSLVHARQALVDPDGDEVPGTVGAPFYVLFWEPDGWKVADGQSMVLTQ